MPSCCCLHSARPLSCRGADRLLRVAATSTNIGWTRQITHASTDPIRNGSDADEGSVFPSLAGWNEAARIHSLRICPYPMVWHLPRPWSETMVSIPLRAQDNPRNKGFSGSAAPIFGFGLADPVPPRGGGRPLFAERLDTLGHEIIKQKRMAWEFLFGILRGSAVRKNILSTRMTWEFPNLVVLNLVVCNFYAEALFCTLLRPLALFCVHLRLRSFALICALLRAFACFCVRPRLEWPRLGTAEWLVQEIMRKIRKFLPINLFWVFPKQELRVDWRRLAEASCWPRSHISCHKDKIRVGVGSWWPQNIPHALWGEFSVATFLLDRGNVVLQLPLRRKFIPN